MLVVEGLQVGYGGAAVLHGVDMRVEAGELVAVVGPNGAGKSTLLRTISGLIKPSAGSITFEGDDLLAIEPDQIVKRGLIQVPEGRMVLGRMSVHENLLLGAHAAHQRTCQDAKSRAYAYRPAVTVGCTASLRRQSAPKRTRSSSPNPRGNMIIRTTTITP